MFDCSVVYPVNIIMVEESRSGKKKFEISDLVASFIQLIVEDWVSGSGLRKRHFSQKHTIIYHMKNRESKV